MDLDNEELEATRRLNGVAKMSDIGKDIKRCEELIKPEHANWIGISNQLAIAGALARIQELEEDNKRKDMFVEMAKEVIENSIPKQKIKDLLTEIQEEYNKVQEQFDCIWNKKSKDDYDRYKLQEFSTMQQQLGFFIGKLEELLEDK